MKILTIHQDICWKRFLTFRYTSLNILWNGRRHLQKRFVHYFISIFINTNLIKLALRVVLCILLHNIFVVYHIVGPFDRIPYSRQFAASDLVTLKYEWAPNRGRILGPTTTPCLRYVLQSTHLMINTTKKRSDTWSLGLKKIETRNPDIAGQAIRYLSTCSCQYFPGAQRSLLPFVCTSGLLVWHKYYRLYKSYNEYSCVQPLRRISRGTSYVYRATCLRIIVLVSLGNCFRVTYRKPAVCMLAIMSLMID